MRALDPSSEDDHCASDDPLPFAKQPQATPISYYGMVLAEPSSPWYNLCRYVGMPSLAKRIVLEHTTGRLAGVSQILGMTPSTEVKVEANEYPTALGYMSPPDPKQRQANHWKTKPRYLVYREWAQAYIPETKHKSQR